METEIKEISIRAAGINNDQAQQMVTTISAKLNAAFQSFSKDGAIPEIRIKIIQNQFESNEQMAERIADRVLEKLRWQIH